MSTQHVRNILNVFRSATDEQIMQGMAWYTTARNISMAMTPTNHRAGAGIIAALSPRTPWSRNIELAWECVNNGGLQKGSLSANIAKANAILAGNDPLTVLSGDKVRAFYCAIAGIDNELTVIDRHMYSIATGITFSKDTRIGKRLYHELSDAYIAAGKRVGIANFEMQSTTWVAYRDSKLGVTDEFMKVA